MTRLFDERIGIFIEKRMYSKVFTSPTESEKHTISHDEF